MLYRDKLQLPAATSCSEYAVEVEVTQATFSDKASIDSVYRERCLNRDPEFKNIWRQRSW